MLAYPCRAAHELVMTTAPPLPPARRWGIEARVVFQTPVRLMSIVSCQISDASSPVSAGSRLPMPAFAQTMPSRPSRSTPSPTAAVSRSVSRTSTTKDSTRRPKPLNQGDGLGEVVGRRHRVTEVRHLGANVDRDDVGPLLGQPHGMASALASGSTRDDCDLPSHAIHSCRTISEPRPECQANVF
jgi:hypothetical protein